MQIQPVTVLTRNDHDPGPEWPSLARKLRIAKHGTERHVSRVRAAEWALAQRYICEDEDAPGVRHVNDRDMDRLRYVAALELHGIGGTCGFGGGSSERMSWASGLGSGRHHARDAASWNSAILDVFGGARNPNPNEVADLIEEILIDEDLAWAVAYSMDRMADAYVPEAAVTWLNVAARAVREMSDSVRSSWLESTAQDWAYEIVEMVEGLPPMAGESSVWEYLARVLPVEAHQRAPMVEPVQLRMLAQAGEPAA